MRRYGFLKFESTEPFLMTRKMRRELPKLFENLPYSEATIVQRGVTTRAGFLFGVDCENEHKGQMMIRRMGLAVSAHLPQGFRLVDIQGFVDCPDSLDKLTKH